MTHTSSILTVSQRITALLDANKANLGLAKVYFGDQELIDVVPTACVEPGGKLREIAAASIPATTQNQIDVFILVYHARVQDTQVTQAEAVATAEAIEAFLHGLPRLPDAAGSDLVIYSWCPELDPGYTYRQNTLYRSARLTWRGITKLRIDQ